MKLTDIKSIIKKKKQQKKVAIQLPDHNALQTDLKKLYSETSDLTIILQCIDSLKEPYIKEAKKCEDCLLFLPHNRNEYGEEKYITHQAAEILHLFKQVNNCIKPESKNEPCKIQKINDKIKFLGFLTRNINEQKAMIDKWDFPETNDRDLSFYYNPLKHVPKIYDQEMLDLLSKKMDEYEKKVKDSEETKKEKSENVIDEIMDILNEDDGSMIPRPASRQDIKDCNEALVDLGLEPLPKGYIDFLKKYNGLAWNGVVFYSTDIVSVAGEEGGFKIMDLVSTNDDFNDRYELDEKVLLGVSDEDYYTYNIETKQYEALERESRETWEQFDKFEELFLFVVGGRLGLHE